MITLNELPHAMPPKKRSRTAEPLQEVVRGEDEVQPPVQPDGNAPTGNGQGPAQDGMARRMGMADVARRYSEK